MNCLFDDLKIDGLLEFTHTCFATEESYQCVFANHWELTGDAEVMVSEAFSLCRCSSYYDV